MKVLGAILAGLAIVGVAYVVKFTIDETLESAFATVRAR
jgi:hypothetical protein